jgi:hypothetical protein
MGKDVEFFNNIKDLTRAKDLEVQTERLRSETKLSKELGEYDYRVAVVEKQHDLDVMIKRHGWDKASLDQKGHEDILDEGQRRALERKKQIKDQEIYVQSLDLGMQIKAREAEIELQKKARATQLEQQQQELEGLAKIKGMMSEQYVREHNATTLEEQKLAKEIELARVQKEREIGIAEAAAKAKAAEAQAQYAGIDTYERALKGQRDHEARIADTDVRKIEQMSKISKGLESPAKAEEKRACPHCNKVAPSSAIFCPECGRHM